jgi:hypothetical protein
MRYRRRDSNLDYTFGGNAEDFLVNSPATVAQAVMTALMLFQGEWFLDVTAGMPWSTQVLGYNTQSLYDRAIKTAILAVQGVQSIVSYSSSLNASTRVLTVNVRIQTIFGTASLTAQIPASGGGYGIGPFAEIPYGGA